MDSQQVFARLRDTFATLYPDTASARRISDDAGIDLGHINFNTGARNYWHDILAEAVRSNLVDRLLELASLLILGEPGSGKSTDATRVSAASADSSPTKSGFTYTCAFQFILLVRKTPADSSMVDRRTA